jgi:hypothetical protein
MTFESWWFDEATVASLEKLRTVEQECRLAWNAAVTAERERCAKLCDDEAAYRLNRELYPLPGDDPAIQGHQALTAQRLARAIRLGPNV